MHPVSPWLLDYPRRWDGVVYFRNKAVLGLPVSTTSYSQHAVSTVQTWLAGPTTARSLTDTGGTTLLPPGLRFYSFFHSKTFIPRWITPIWKHKTIRYLASNQKLLDFYRTISSWHFYRPIHTSTTQGHLGFMQLGFQTTPKHNAQVINTYLCFII